MKPSDALVLHREAIRRIVATNRGQNPRVFGSVLRRQDTEASDLDLLIDPTQGMTMFDVAAMACAIEQLTASKVDIRTPGDLSPSFRSKVVGVAQQI